MTGRVARRRLGPLIGPLGRPGIGARSWAGLILIKIAALGALAAILAGAAVREAEGLRDRLGDPVTVAIWASGLESADAAAGRTEEILARVDGVTAVRSLDPTPQDAGIARLMGAAPDQARDARLLVLDTRRDPAAVAAAAAQALASGSIPARVDDHRWPASATTRTLAGAAGAAVLVFLGLALCLAATCVWITRREIAARPAQIDLLRLLGASEAAIARQFAGRTIRLALWAACLGAAAAMAAVGLWVRFARRLPLAPPVSLSHPDLVWPLFWVLATGLIALPAATLAARAGLRPGR